MISVLLVDDQAQIREAIAALLARERDMQVVGQAQSGGEAVSAARALEPTVVLMDAEMPGGIDGIEATKLIHEASPASRVIGFSMHDGRTAEDFIQAGAYSFLSKSVKVQVLITTIRSAGGGEVVHQ